jgi:hypothetical protein
MFVIIPSSTTAAPYSPPPLSPSPHTLQLCQPILPLCRTHRGWGRGSRWQLSSRRCHLACRLGRRRSTLRSRWRWRWRTGGGGFSWAGWEGFDGEGRWRWRRWYGRGGRAYLCGSFDVLGVAADEGGLLVGHCCDFGCGGLEGFRVRPLDVSRLVRVVCCLRKGFDGGWLYCSATYT